MIPRLIGGGVRYVAQSCTSRITWSFQLRAQQTCGERIALLIGVISHADAPKGTSPTARNFIIKHVGPVELRAGSELFRTSSTPPGLAGLFGCPG